MTYEDLGGAITSYLLGLGAFLMDSGPIALLGAALLVIRLCYEGLRLVRYIKSGEAPKEPVSRGRR